IEVVAKTVEFAGAAQEDANSLVEVLREGLNIFEQSSGDKKSNEQAVQFLKDAVSIAKKVDMKLTKAQTDSPAVNVLRQQFADDKERMLALYESAAVGLSARGLAHELRTH